MKRSTLATTWVCLALSSPVLAAEPPPTEPAAAEGAQASLQTLTALHAELTAVRTELAQRRAALEYPPSAKAKAEIAASVVRLEGRESALMADIEQVASGLSPEALDGGIEEEFDLMTEVEALVRPLLEELKEATETPRRVEALRSELARLATREKKKVEAAIARIQVLKDTNEDAGLGLLLDESLHHWESERTATRTRIAVADHKLERRVQEQTSFIESTGDVVGGFFESRGLNILYAIAAFLGTFVALRLLYSLIRLIVFRRRQREERTFATRLLYVVFNFLTGILATIAALIALYTTGDWVLLGLALLLLFGVVWASKNAVVVFFDQIRLLMNIGPVREGERLVYRSIPWRVERIGIFTQLVNPVLASGLLRLSSREVLELHSRPLSARDVWFPCEQGDWVRLSDGCYGRVLGQTPDFVQIEQAGGSVVTYETPALLAQSPVNLSRGFRVVARFGVDYAHQPIATGEIPEKMASHLREVLLPYLGEAKLKRVAVELDAAGSSSIDYVALIDVRGDAAGKYYPILRLAQRALVELCTAEGWTIPFPQLTVHGAAAASPG